MSMRGRSFLRALVLTLISVVLAHPVGAQDSKTSWILGVWEGKHTGPFIPDDTSRFEFVADGGTIE